MDQIPKNLKDDYPFLKNKILDKKFLCYHLDASVGLTGIVLTEGLFPIESVDFVNSEKNLSKKF